MLNPAYQNLSSVSLRHRAPRLGAAMAIAAQSASSSQASQAEFPADIRKSAGRRVLPWFYNLFEVPPAVLARKGGAGGGFFQSDRSHARPVLSGAATSRLLPLMSVWSFFGDLRNAKTARRQSVGASDKASRKNAGHENAQHHSGVGRNSPYRISPFRAWETPSQERFHLCVVSTRVVRVR